MAKSRPGYATKGSEIIKAIQKLTYGHTTWDIFQDWLEMSAILISNTVDWGQQKKCEERYMEIVKKYSKEEMEQFTKMLDLLIEEMTRQTEISGPCDILGEVFHGLELHNKYHGQFFTPFHICECMGRMVLDDSLHKTIDDRGYVSLCEPCVGAGGMVIGFANAMQQEKMNYQQQLCVTACDIDLKCVHMAYLQLSLYGIPAVIIHGNSLTLEEWSRWYTPAYMIGMWPLKERRNIQNIANATKEKTDISTVNSQELATYYEFTEENNGQLSLF